MVISIALQFLLTPKPKVEGGRPKGLGDFDFPTATEDRAVPIVWGTVDIKGPNVLWYGDLRIFHKRKTKGGVKITVAFQYFVGMDLLLCYGPLDRITRLEVSDHVVDDTKVSPTFPVTPTAAGLAVEFTDDTLLGGIGKGGGIVGTMRMYSGDPDSLQNAYLQTQLGNDIPGYVNIAHVVTEQTGVGESHQIGAYVFRVTRFPDNLGLTGDNHIIRGTIDDGDANPAEILYEILTSDLFGLSIDPSRIDIASFTAAGNTLADEQNGMSWIITSVTPALELINEITRQTDAVFFEDASGSFCVRLIRDDYTPAALPLFDESNVTALNNFSRTGWGETQNHINIGYADRNKDFQSTGAMSQDLANVRIQAAEVRADYSYPAIKHADTAQAIAERELRVMSFPLAKVVFTATREAAFLIPGDVVRFSWDELEISEMVIRVMQVDLGDIVNGKVKVTGAQDVFRVAEAIYSSPQATGWVAPNTDPAALVAGEELVREMPRIFGNLYPDQIVNPVLARTWNLVQRPAAQPTTTGIELFVDPAAGTAFISGFGDIALVPIALLEAEYPQATADIEISDLLEIDDELDLINIDDVIAVQVAAGFNLVLIQGATQAEDEVVGFEQLIDDGDGTFKLKTVHRGLMDTQARTHAAGAKAWLFAEGPSYSSATFPPTLAITARHVPGTDTGVLDVADALTQNLTFAQRTLRPHHPANFTVNTSTRVPAATDETADLDLDWEHRFNSDVTVRDADDGDATGQDTDVEYDLEFFNEVTTASLRTVTLNNGGTWLTYLYTAANLQADTGEVGNFPLEVSMKARYKASPANGNPANLESLQDIRRAFNVDMGGATVQSIDLDGTTEYLAETSNSAMGLVDEFSISVWVRGTSSAGGAVRDILHLKNSGSNVSRVAFTLTDDSAASAFNVTLWDSAGTLFKDYDFGSFSVNTWTMLTITWDGTNLTVYQDASAQTPTLNTDNAGTMNDGGRQVTVGGSSAQAASWVGQIFSPATWINELTAAEITAIDAGTSTFNLRASSGNYVSHLTLNHLWDFRTSANIGQDYRNSTTGSARDIDTNAANISAADLNAGEVP